jgi:gluconolactonase
MPGTSGIFEFDIDSRGFPINKRLFGVARFGAPDGLHTDDYGRVWTGESDGIVVRNKNGQIIGIFNQLTLKDQKIAGAIAQLSLAEDTLIIFAQTRLWRIQLAQTVKKGGSAGN